MSVDNSINMSNLRKDLDYSSEVNSCDSTKDGSSLHGDLISTCVNNDKTCNKSLIVELEKTKLALQEKVLLCESQKIKIDKVEAEIVDLTTSLFEEANKMVYDANLKHDKAEKKLAFAEGKIAALEIEISALKSLVITSTPSNPNPKSHPQLIKKSENSPIRSRQSKNAFRNNRKSEKSEEYKIEQTHDASSSCVCLKLQREIDEVIFSRLKQWHESISELPIPTQGTLTAFCSCNYVTSDCSPLDQCEMISQSPFLRKIFDEDISPCLTFMNTELAARVSSCIHKNLLSVELASSHSLEAPQICSLSRTKSPCKHRIRFSDADTWHSISQSSRNRITSVCNFFTYLRYIRQGIVKHDVEQIYWEITKLRLEIAFATLGYYKDVC